MTSKFVSVLASVLFLLALITLNLNAQKAPMKYGKVDMADMEMTSYPLDTSAAAVVLCNYGYFNSTSIQFVQVIRIKILKKEGLSWGDRAYPGYSKSNVRGLTYNFENGKIVETKLKSESVFRERVTDDLYRLRVAMPNLKEGSIFDIEFSYSFIPSFWYFQMEIPVRWSELIIEPSQYFEFRKNYTGFIPLVVNTDMRWVAQDVPAFKSEPYMNAMTNYISKFEFDILRITFPGNYKEYSTDWDAVNRRLDESDYFGNTMQGALFLNSTAKEIESTYTDPMDKIRAAYEFVKKAVKWNEEESISTTTTVLSSPYNKKIGNSTDINLILVQLLKKLDFAAYPVAMSSRSNGVLRVYAPSLEKLNYTIACIKLNDKTLLLDATEDYLPFGLLPYRALNERGRIIDKNKTDWVEIVPPKKEKEFIQGILSFDGTDVLKGKLTYTKADYAAFDFRKAYAKFNGQDEYLKDFESDNQGVLVDNFTVKDIDSIYKPVVAEYDVIIKNKVNVLGDLLYVNPMLFEQIDENPFKLDERKFPVDFVNPIEKIYMVTFNLPEGYKVEQLPKPLIIKMPENTASCIYQISSLNTSVQVMFKFLINKPVFYTTEYGQLKMFFDEVVKKQAELIVLKKI